VNPSKKNHHNRCNKRTCVKSCDAWVHIRDNNTEGELAATVMTADDSFCSVDGLSQEVVFYVGCEWLTIPIDVICAWGYSCPEKLYGV